MKKPAKNLRKLSPQKRSGNTPDNSFNPKQGARFTPRPLLVKQQSDKLEFEMRLCAFQIPKCKM